MPNITKAVILAGGEGTRITPVAKDTPKALMEIGGISILEHQILLLNRYGVQEVWLLLGVGADQIEKLIREKNLGVGVHVKKEEELLGTAGALKQLEGEIQEDFFTFSGDIMLDMDLDRLGKWHKEKEGILSLVVHPNDHPFDSDLVEIDAENKIVSLLKRPHPEGKIFRNLSIASLYIFSSKIFQYIPEGYKADIEKDILPLLLKAKERVYAYNTPEYIKDMGTPERLEQVRRDYESGKIQKMNLKNARRAIFLDRDGVLNEQVDQLSRVEEFKLYEFVGDAIKKINETDFLAIIVSNQAMVAKGFMTEQEIEEMQKKMETQLGEKGAKIDGAYYCFHHPEEGFEGERSELKGVCDCRKPNPGLLLRAKEDFHVCLQDSYMIGDKTADILAGKNAGCKTILVQTGYKGKDGKYSVRPDWTARNLAHAVKIVTS